MANTYQVNYDDAGLPKTLLDWRREPHRHCDTASHLWTKLDSIFEEHGFKLFVTNQDYESSYTSPISRERTSDAYHFIHPGDGRGHRCSYGDFSNKLVPAVCKADGRHVMIELVRKGGQGQTELDILRHFSQPALQDHPHNHVIPLLGEIRYSDMTFAILPLLGTDGFSVPWFLNFGEALEAVVQTFEGLAFLHSHLVAHRDLGNTDILLNFGGSRWGPNFRKAINERIPFRELGKCRYYFVDFEMAVKYEANSDPATRVVEGMPTLELHGHADPKAYGKPMPPEWTSGKAYCPFKSDVYQLGRLWQRTLALDEKDVEVLVKLLGRMTDRNPSHRPDMVHALSRLLDFRGGLSADMLLRDAKEQDWNIAL